MNRRDMEQRTLLFGVRSLRFLGTLRETAVTRVAIYQLTKAATSVGANYAEAGRAQSRADFISKIAIAEKEAAESHYWYKVIGSMKWGKPEEAAALLTESGELLAILVQTGRTAKTRSSAERAKMPASTSAIRHPTSDIHS